MGEVPWWTFGNTGLELRQQTGWGVSDIEEVGKSMGGGRTAQVTACKEEKAMAKITQQGSMGVEVGREAGQVGWR